MFSIAFWFQEFTTSSFKSNSFSRGKPKQQGRQLLSKELPVQAASDDPGGRVQGMGGSWPPYPADAGDAFPESVWPAGLKDWPERVEGQVRRLMIGPIIFYGYGRHSWIPAVSITPGSRPTLLRPQNAEAQRTVRRKIMKSPENQNGQSWLVKVGLESEGHHKQRPILRGNPSWGRHLFAQVAMPISTAHQYCQHLSATMLQTGQWRLEVALIRLAGWCEDVATAY